MLSNIDLSFHEIAHGKNITFGHFMIRDYEDATPVDIFPAMTVLSGDSEVAAEICESISDTGVKLSDSGLLSEYQDQNILFVDISASVDSVYLEDACSIIKSACKDEYTIIFHVGRDNDVAAGISDNDDVLFCQNGSHYALLNKEHNNLVPA